jgi:hypothetical protein
VEAAASFTVTFSDSDITGLGTNQVLKFDLIISNQGNGYNKNTGVFTAPSSERTPSS